MADGDSDILESWEDFEENDILEKRLNEMKLKSKPTSKEPSPDGDFTIAVPVEEGSRTAYNHTPQVKILKRNPSGNGSEAANSRNAKTTKPVKTLEQREAEYAEARLRIMGSAYCSEENSEDDSSQRPANLVQSEEAKNKDNVIRQPKGPDGTKGFKSDR